MEIAKMSKNLANCCNQLNSVLPPKFFTVRYNSQQSWPLATHSATSHFLVGSDISDQGVICVSYLI